MTEATYFSAGIKYEQVIPEGSSWANTIIVMNTIIKQNGIKYNNGIITLEAGKTYRVTAQLGFQGDYHRIKPACSYTFGLFTTNGMQIGPLAEALDIDLKTSNTSGNFLDVIHIPPTTDKYCIRMTSDVKADSSSLLREEGTFLNIVQIMPGTDVLSLRRVDNQTIPSNTWAGQNIIMTPVTNVGGIKYDKETGEFTLRGRKTYRITAQLAWQASTPQWYAFGLFDSTGDQIGPAAEALSPDIDTCNASGSVLDVIHTPLNTEKFCLRMTPGVTAGSSSSIRADVGTFLNIVSIPEEKSYMSARRFIDQPLRRSKYPTDLKIPTIINMQILEKRGTIKYSPDLGGFTLNANKAYRFTAQVGIEAKLPGDYELKVASDDVDQKILPFSIAVSPNLPDGRKVSCGVYDIIFIPERDITGFFEITPNNGDCEGIVRATTSTFLTIVEL